MRPALAWNWSGHVNARPYNQLDVAAGGGICLLLLGGLKDIPKAAAEAAKAPTLSVDLLVMNMVVLLVLCALLLGYLMVVRRLHPADLFGLRRLRFFPALGTAFLAMIPTWLIVGQFSNEISVWLQGFWPDSRSQDMVEAFRGSNSVAAKWALVAAAVVVAPLVEETIFRGFIYGVIKRYTDGYFAAICSALLFATVHFHVGSLFPLAILALAFCFMYEVTGSLLVTMLMHAIFNATSLMILASLPGDK
jgi:membrane protease YdiL (CAAX protease family)